VVYAVDAAGIADGRVEHPMRRRQNKATPIEVFMDLSLGLCLRQFMPLSEQQQMTTAISTDMCEALYLPEED
jgi:hypothetical protein